MANYKLVQGYDAALDLICRMRNCDCIDIYKCESVIKYGDIRGERQYMEGPDGDYYEIVILIMQKENGYYPDMDTIRKKAYEDVRTGRFAIQPR